MTDISCPNCGAEMDLTVLLSSVEDRRALARLAALSVPLGARVLRYVQLHRPARQRLTLPKQVKLLLQLLPDLEREAITWKGRDWPAPREAWAQAIDQMLAARDAGRLELPMKGHGYLYAIVAGMADKNEAAAEARREQDRRQAAQARAGQRGMKRAADALPVPRPSGPAPAPGTSPTVRAMRAELAAKKRAAKQDGDAS